MWISLTQEWEKLQPKIIIALFFYRQMPLSWTQRCPIARPPLPVAAPRSDVFFDVNGGNGLDQIVACQGTVEPSTYFFFPLLLWVDIQIEIEGTRYFEFMTYYRQTDKSPLSMMQNT